MGHDGVVKLLLDRGANINIQDKVSERYGCGVDVGCLRVVAQWDCLICLRVAMLVKMR